jgi:hypothetical protein
VLDKRLVAQQVDLFVINGFRRGHHGSMHDLELPHEVNITAARALDIHRRLGRASSSPVAPQHTAKAASPRFIGGNARP